MSASASRWSVENISKVQARIALQPSGPTATASRDQRYHAAAAVVTRFVIDPGYHRDAEAARNLLADSLLVEEAAGRQYWSLKNDVRKRVLAGLRARDELARALADAPERPDDVLQQVLETWIRGQPKPLDEQTPTELSATLQVVDWLETTELETLLPDTEDVRRRVDYAGLLQPFRDLVGDYFRGRTRELGVLHDYLVDAGGSGGALRPLLIHGPGGMGKSTLLSKFILETVATGSGAIVYLDCDRPGLVAEEPLTLLAEAVRQLGLQFQRLRDSSVRLRASWLSDLAHFRAGASDALESIALESVATRDRQGYVQSFALFARDLPETVPVLLVIDTFEELQYRSRDFVGELFGFLGELHAALPRLRIAISGRDEVLGFNTERLPLAELDTEAAEGYLAARGVQRSDLRQALARALHGNPLSLRLAATLVTVEEISDTELGQLERIVDDTQIQGILYRRILKHLHDKDPELEQIAHPGLILRRITPDLIRRVLAKACGLAIDSDEQARALFNRLRDEMTLVIPDGDAVRHRPDVRRVMLPALYAAERQRTDAIQHAAIEFYLRYDDAASRAEELYHRLMLGQPAAEIDKRWTVPGVDDLLRGALDDLTGPARAYLASRLRIEVYDHDLDTLEPVVWERTVANRAESLIRLDRPLEALDLMRRRAFRSPDSPLYWLEARVLRQLGRNREARQIARACMVSLEGRPIAAEQLDLYILSAETDEAIGSEVDWDAVLARNRQLGRTLAHEPRFVRFALPYLRLAVRAGLRSAAVDELTEQAVTALSAMPRQSVAALVQELPSLPAFDPFRSKAADPPTASGRHPRESYALTSADASELVDALLEAVPTMSDLSVLLTDLGAGNQINLSTSLLEALHNVVGWAEQTGRTGDLVSQAAALNPKAYRLQELLARQGTRVVPAEANPFTAVLLPGGRPFFDRGVLRLFMRDLLAPAPQARVLSILGSPGSGKSYTSVYLSYLASATGAFDCGIFELGASWTIEDVVGSIHSAFKWRWDNDVDRTAPTARQVTQYVNQVVNRTRRSRRVTVMFFDRDDSTLPDAVGQFVRRLAELVSRVSTSMAVITCGFGDIPPDVCRVETLGPLSKGDLLEGLTQLAPATDRSLIDQAADDILRRVAVEEPGYNAKVNRLAASYAASLLDAAAPVRVFISHASQDTIALNRVLEDLAPLRAQGLVHPWSTRDLQAGVEWRSEIARQLSLAEVVLLVGTKTFVRLKQAESVNLPHLLARQEKNELRVLAAQLEDDADVRALDSRLAVVEPKGLVAAVRGAAMAVRSKRVQRTSLA